MDAVVVDVGGTTSDVGLLVGGFPRQAGLLAEIGGVQTNYAIPDTVSVGLGVHDRRAYLPLNVFDINRLVSSWLARFSVSDWHYSVFCWLADWVAAGGGSLLRSSADGGVRLGPDRSVDSQHRILTELRGMIIIGKTMDQADLESPPG